MIGGGGGSYGGRRWLSELEETSRARTGDATYEAESSAYLKDLLGAYNSRDAGRIREHLDAIKACAEADLSGTVDLAFGGSVRKHTYVDGLSDVDALLIVNRTELAHATPKEVLGFLRRTLAEGLPGVQVKSGALAVTLTFRDGLELQVLPALRTGAGIRIADAEGQWSRVVRPNDFAGKLTAVNQAQGRQVVPAIKLFKGLQQGLPKTQQLSGYHVESLAIEAFRDYTGSKTPKAMLQHLVREAAARVARPIVDPTGQSRHVDDALGSAGSVERARVGAALQRMADRLDAAERTRSVDQFRALFED